LICHTSSAQISSPFRSRHTPPRSAAVSRNKCLRCSATQTRRVSKQPSGNAFTAQTCTIVVTIVSASVKSSLPTIRRWPQADTVRLVASLSLSLSLSKSLTDSDGSRFELEAHFKQSSTSSHRHLAFGHFLPLPLIHSHFPPLFPLCPSPFYHTHTHTHMQMPFALLSHPPLTHVCFRYLHLRACQSNKRKSFRSFSFEDCRI
jgi:hypothetical protein